MGRNLIVLFDGTWNKQKDNTNVIRMRQSIATTGEDDPEQPCLYDRGLGTHWYDRAIGGAFGYGLSRNIQQGYRWLCSKYKPGDNIYVFGFSRGAYTARSMVGLIRKCGVLKSPSDDLIENAYELYRDKDVGPDEQKAVDFRKAHSLETRVKFVGVWDTVGTLGIPASHVMFSRDYYTWHDTELSKIVDFAYHAIASDEYRKDFEATVWTKIKPENIDVEQKWFIGAHANVGGGINPDLLPNAPLRWMQDKAENAGLKLRSKASIGQEDYLAKIDDSYEDFAYGLYKLFNKRYIRTFGKGVKELVDETVWDRCKKKDLKYSPSVFERHPDRPG